MQYTSEDKSVRVYGDIEREDSNHDVQELYKFAEEALLGESFWSGGYFVSMGGLDKEKIKSYVKYQEGEDRKEDGTQDILF